MGIYAVLEAVLVGGLSFLLYVLIEKPGLRVSAQLRQKSLLSRERKDAARALHPQPSDEACAADRTEPRQTVVLAKTSRR